MDKSVHLADDPHKHRELWVKDLFYMHKRCFKSKEKLPLSQNTLILPQKYQHIEKDYTTTASIPLRLKSKMCKVQQSIFPPHTRHFSSKDLRLGSQIFGKSLRHVKGREISVQLNDKENTKRCNRRAELAAGGLMPQHSVITELRRNESAPVKSCIRLKTSTLRLGRAL